MVKIFCGIHILPLKENDCGFHQEVKKSLEDMSRFCGTTNTPVLTSGDVCPGFQSQGEFCQLHASLPVQNRFLRFTSNVTPANLLAASKATKLFHPHFCIQTLVGVGSRIKLANLSEHVKRQTL